MFQETEIVRWASLTVCQWTAHRLTSIRFHKPKECRMPRGCCVICCEIPYTRCIMGIH